MHYEQELGAKDLKKLFKPFASIQNRILIDYKKLRDHILARLDDKLKEKPSPPQRFSEALKTPSVS